MTEAERHNEIVKARATFANALAIGTIIAGGLSALSDGRYLAAFVFTLVGLTLHYVALRTLREMEVETDE